MSGLRNSFRFRKGVSELVGGLIVISILLVSFISITLAFQQSSISSISSYGSRARFEQERSEEVVEALLKDGECYLINVGPVDVEIVRGWSGESFTDLDAVLKPKTNLSVSSLGNPDFIVTSRGNVFPAKYACMKQEQQNQGGSGGGAFNSNSTLGDLTYLKPDDIRQVGIVATVDGNRKYVAYYYNRTNRWYINNGTEWVPASTVDDEPRPDIDGNGVNELILSDSYPEVTESVIDKNTFNSNITFIDIAKINENTDTVTIYYKLVMNISKDGIGNPHDIIFEVSISLHNEDGSVQTPSAVLATNTYEKNNYYVYVMMGEAYFPLKAFSAFHEELKEGIYSVSILLEAEGQSSKPKVQNLRIETIAIVGADITWSSG